MKDSIFREKSIDRINSPEKFDEYVKVSNPGVWMLMAAMLISLVAVIIWAVSCVLNTTIPAAVVAQSGNVVAYIMEDNADIVKPGQEIVLHDGSVLKVKWVDSSFFFLDIDKMPKILHALGREEDTWACRLEVEGTLPDGAYSADVIVDTVKPATFVMN